MRDASYDVCTGPATTSCQSQASYQAGAIAGAIQYVPLQETSPEERIATMVREDLGITVNPQAVRMFIRARWGRLSKAAHEVHDA